MDFHVKDMALSAMGKKRIEWAESDMPVLRKVKENFAKKKPLRARSSRPVSMSPPRPPTS